MRPWSRVRAAARHATAISVRIGSGPSEATRLLPMALSRLRPTHPEVRVLVEYGLNEVLMPMVRQRRDRVRAVVDPADRGAIRICSTDAARRRRRRRFARPAIRWPGAASLSGDDLQRFPWVLARRWELERNALDELFAEAGLKPVEPVIETTSAIADEDAGAAERLPHLRPPRDDPLGGARADLLRPLMAISIVLGAPCRHHDAARADAGRRRWAFLSPRCASRGRAGRLALAPASGAESRRIVPRACGPIVRDFAAPMEMHLSTETVPLAHRIAYWNDAICAAFVRLDLECDSRLPFRSELAVALRPRTST